MYCILIIENRRILYVIFIMILIYIVWSQRCSSELDDNEMIDSLFELNWFHFCDFRDYS